MSINDREILQTALALGQLGPVDRAEAERLLAGDPDQQAVHDSIARLAEELRAQCRQEALPRASAALRQSVAAKLASAPRRPTHTPALPRRSNVIRRPVLAASLAASVILNVGALYYFGIANRSSTELAQAERLPATGANVQAQAEQTVVTQGDSSHVALEQLAGPLATTPASVAKPEVHGLPGDAAEISARDLVMRGGQLIGQLQLALPPEQVTWSRPTTYLHDLTPLLSQPISVASTDAGSQQSAAHSSATESIRTAFGPNAVAAAVQNLPGNRVAPFISTRGAPLLLGSLHVGDESVLQAERELAAGRWPAVADIDVSQFVNHFAQSVADGRAQQAATPTTSAEPISLWSETVVCPWQPTHRLAVLVIKANKLPGLQGRAESAALHDVVAEVELNAGQVAAFRTFSARAALVSASVLRDQQTVAVSLTPGTIVTSVYELVPMNQAPVELKYQSTATLNRTSPKRELMTVKVRYTRDDRTDAESSELIVADDARLVPQATPVTQRAVVAVATGLLLRREGTVGTLSWRELLRWCQSQDALASHPAGNELVGLVRLASNLPARR